MNGRHTTSHTEQEARLVVKVVLMARAGVPMGLATATAAMEDMKEVAVEEEEEVWMAADATAVGHTEAVEQAVKMAAVVVRVAAMAVAQMAVVK